MDTLIDLAIALALVVSACLLVAFPLALYADFKRWPVHPRKRNGGKR